MVWTEDFPRWYIGSFLILFGILMIWKGRSFGCCKRFFYLELRDPHLKDRFAPVIERRSELEGDNTTTRRIAGYCAAFFGALVFLKVTSPVVGYALLCADLAVINSQLYLRMRNRSARRAASLQPRSITSAVPAVWFAGGIVASILPLALWNVHSARGSAFVVAVSCAVIVWLAARTSDMAALLAGDDPDIEVYVDNRLRWSRVAGLLVLAYAVSYVFIAMSKVDAASTSALINAAFTASWVLFFGFGIWAAVVFFRGRMRAKASSV
jgi:hypothetical protein